MESEKKISYSTLIKWTRIIGIVAIALSMLYFVSNFRLFTVPDDWVHLHPEVLPGERWLYKRSNEIHKNLFRGNLAVFTADQGQGQYLHVSLVVGFPGERIEFDPEKLEFSANDTPIGKKFLLAGEWLESPYELVVLAKNEYMLIDNNVLPDEKRIWIVNRENLFGKFLFKLPF